MRKISLALSIIVFVAFHSRAAEPDVLVTKDTVRNAIAAFRQDPFSPRGRAAGEVVRRFAQKDDSVIVQITPKVVPFINDLKIPQEDRTLFLDAFVLGNVDAQFLRNEKKDDPYSGVTEMIETYKQMKKRNPAANIPDIEKFMEMEKHGELKKYLATP
jgi:hypothetical protein